MSNFEIDKIQIGEDLLVMNNITKIYSNGFVANKNVNFSIKKGEIHGLVGENGAGKTTLMKVLFGQENLDDGEILYCNQPLQIKNPLVALEKGIGMVHQHFMLVESLSVAENMVLGKEPKKGILYDKKEAIKMTEEVSKLYNLKVDPNVLVRDLSIGYKQRVEILKMLLHGAKVLLLDEPTAVLTPQETEELFKQLKELKNKGFSIVFISHKLNEVKEICDRITVLRSGESKITTDVKDLSEDDISKLIVGKDVELNIVKNDKKISDVVLSVRNLSYKNKFGLYDFHNLNFDVCGGEILGVAGVEGNGQSELANVIAGILKQSGGDIKINGESSINFDIRTLREKGVSIVHEDRMIYGACKTMSIEQNIVSDRYYKQEYCDKGLIDWKKVRKDSENLIKEYSVKCDGASADIKTLSGGNIQKVVAAREFSNNPKLLIASHPTRGIDIGAADLIRRKMLNLRDNGTATLLFSADLTELISLSDSIIVMYEGNIVAYFESTTNLTETMLGEYMLGIKKQSDEEIGGVLHC